MLSETLFRRPRAAGIHVIQRRGEQGARELTTRRLVLDAGTSASFRLDDEETVVVLHEGKGTWSAGSKKWPVGRSNVFKERATALYLPPGTEATFTADTHMEAVLMSTPAAAGGDVAITTPAEVEGVARGRGNYSREVHNMFVTDGHARRLMVGETFNAPGNWSSYPPHKHDGRDGEPKLEEVYYFRVDPPQGFGHQMLYTERRRVGDARRARRRCGAPAVRIPSGLGAARLSAVLPVGHGGRAAQAGAPRRSGASLDPRRAGLSGWRSRSGSASTGKTALVTGASRGLGAAMARGLAEAGANVVLHASHEAPRAAADAIASECGVRTGCLTADLADRDAAERLDCRCGCARGRARHPRQQRGHHPPVRRGGTCRRGLGRRDCRESLERVPVVSGGRPADARARRRKDHQRRVAAVVPGRHPRARVRRGERWRGAADQGARQRVGRPRRQRQRHRPWIHADRQHARAA